MTQTPLTPAATTKVLADVTKASIAQLVRLNDEQLVNAFATLKSAEHRNVWGSRFDFAKSIRFEKRMRALMTEAAARSIELDISALPVSPGAS